MADTLAGRITVAIARQQSEVDRLTTAATVELPAAQAKLNQLQNAASRVTPSLENLFAFLLVNSIVE